MSYVGIIANPASGKDIRRLVAHGSVFDNDEKVSIVRRALLGLDAVGVERVEIMPDRFGIGLKALNGLALKLDAGLLEMRARFTQEDSRRAAEMLVDKGARCLIVLGGDGTNRIVSKACAQVPLMPFATSTNNVFPVMIEATIAGMAAGLVAAGRADAALARAPRLDILRGEDDDRVRDIALIDAVVYAERFIAARAIWDEAKIRDIVLTRAEPGNIGLSSVGAHLLADGCPAAHALHIRIGPGGRSVMAPIAPGLFRPVPVASHQILAPGEKIPLRYAEPCTLALDGEREMQLKPGTTTFIRLNLDGPNVVDAHQAVAAAAAAGYFVHPE